MHGVFGEVCNAGTIVDLVALYEPDAFLVPQLGQRVIRPFCHSGIACGFCQFKRQHASEKSQMVPGSLLSTMPLPTPETSSFPLKIVC
jgi:hypothetical protein